MRWRHRYAIRLLHLPIARAARVPRRRFLSWRWGNASEIVSVTETTLQFSRDTAAARAIREQLAEFGVG